MLLKRKALYNLIRLNLNRIQMGEFKINNLESWQTENYRQSSTEQLFHRLNTLGIKFDLDGFENYADSHEIPEEMVENLTQAREPLEKDQVYLIVFELWRPSFLRNAHFQSFVMS